MSRPTAMSPEEQEQLARQIGVLLLQEAPEDWQQITVEYRATGDYEDLLAEVTGQDETVRAWEPPQDLVPVFQQLRSGMYRSDVGTWLSALYVVDRPASYRIDINFDTEPRWDQQLPDSAYAEEIARHPRAEENLPDWWRAKLSNTEHAAPAAPAPAPPPAGEPAQSGPHVVATFDDRDEQGRPVVTERAPVPAEEQQALRHYLENAPIVRPARVRDADELDPQGAEVVPRSWHTDGTWVWPGAVVYYLTQYGVPPAEAFVADVRARGFTLPGVSAQAHEAAALRVMDEVGPETAESAPAHPQAAPPPPQVESAAAQPAPMNSPSPSEVPAPELAEHDDPGDHGEPELFTHPTGAAQTASVSPLQQDSEDSGTAQSREVPADSSANSDAAPAAAAFASSTTESRTPSDHEQRVLGGLHERFAGFGVHPSSYRLGDEQPGAWCLVPDNSGWSVYHDTGVHRQDLVQFHHVEQAAAYLLGSLLLGQHEPSTDQAHGDALAPGTPPATPAEPAAAEAPAESAPQQPAASGEPANPLFAAASEPSAAESPTRMQPLQASEAEQRNGAALPHRSTTNGAGPHPGGQDRPAEPGTAPPPADQQPLQGSGPPPGNAGAPHHPGPPPPAGPGGEQRPGPPGPPHRPPQAEPGPGGLKRPPQQPTPQHPAPQGQPPPPGPGQPPQAAGGPSTAPPRPGHADPSQVRGAGQQIQPLRGEPPLTLFRERRQIVLPPGTEVDRFGEPGGNVTYAARTPYPNRSLPPQWINRNYYAYRVQRPVQAVHGLAVPWFEQPGGGTAYVLPTAIEELLSDGTVVELTGEEAPPRPQAE